MAFRICICIAILENWPPKMAECLYETNWQDLSVDLQKYSILMISNMQKPRFHHGFGVAVLNLETFTQVSNSPGMFFSQSKTDILLFYCFFPTVYESSLYLLHAFQDYHNGVSILAV